MIIEGIIGGAALGGTALIGVLAKRRSIKLQNMAHQLEESVKTPPMSLAGISGGVYIRTQKGSEHYIQNQVEQTLVAAGLSLFNLQTVCANKLLTKGTWDDNIAQGLIDVAVVGRLVIGQVESEQTKYVSVQHVDTNSGKRFDALESTNPSYREPNCCDCLDVRRYMLKGEHHPLSSDHMYSASKRPHFCEPLEEFERRRELEKIVERIKEDTFSLDVRFYGRNGEIHGGYAEGYAGNSYEPIELLVKGVTDALIKAASKSLQSHQRSAAELELR